MAAQSPEQPGTTGNNTGGEAESATSSILSEFFRLEQQRIAAQNDPDASQLNGSLNDQAEHRRYSRLALVGLIVPSGVFLALLVLVLLMAFFGDPRQSELALRILTIGGQAVGGGGFLFLVAFAINRLTRQ